ALLPWDLQCPGRAVPVPARVHAMDQLSAWQPVLALPVDRGRLAARAVGTAHRRHRLAGPPPGGLNRPSHGTGCPFGYSAITPRRRTHPMAPSALNRAQRRDV